jgi:hypothetical protein
VEGVAQTQGALARLAADDEARRRGRGFAEQALDQLGVRRTPGAAADPLLEVDDEGNLAGEVRLEAGALAVRAAPSSRTRSSVSARLIVGLRAKASAWWANSSRMEALWVSVASLIDQS